MVTHSGSCPAASPAAAGLGASENGLYVAWARVIDVHQVVRDRAGTIVADRMVQHVYLIEHGVIRSMEIQSR